jgi:hypothetical protein
VSEGAQQVGFSGPRISEGEDIFTAVKELAVDEGGELALRGSLESGAVKGGKGFLARESGGGEKFGDAALFALVKFEFAQGGKIPVVGPSLGGGRFSVIGEVQGEGGQMELSQLLREGAFHKAASSPSRS